MLPPLARGCHLVHATHSSSSEAKAMSLFTRSSRFLRSAVTLSSRRRRRAASTAAAAGARAAAPHDPAIPRTFYFNPSRTTRLVAWCPTFVLAGAGLLSWYNYEMTKLVWDRMTSRKKNEVVFPLVALAMLGTVFFAFGRIQGRRYITQMDLIQAPAGALSPNLPYVRITTVGCPLKVRHKPMSIEEFMYHLPFQSDAEFDRVKGQTWIQLRDMRETQSKLSPKFVFNWELDADKSTGVKSLLQYLPKGGLGGGKQREASPAISRGGGGKKRKQIPSR